MTDSADSSRFLSRRPGRSAIAAVVLLFTGFVAGFVAAFLVWLLLGGGVWRSEVRVVEAELRSPDTLALIVDSCNGNPEVSLLRETDVDVQVKVVASSTPLLGGQDCLDAVEVQLQEPLGDRVVVDKHTGQLVNVNIINSKYNPIERGAGTRARRSRTLRIRRHRHSVSFCPAGFEHPLWSQFAHRECLFLVQDSAGSRWIPAFAGMTG